MDYKFNNSTELLLSQGNWSGVFVKDDGLGGKRGPFQSSAHFDILSRVRAARAISAGQFKLNYYF